jgi:hypothetical protein
MQPTNTTSIFYLKGTDQRIGARSTQSHPKQSRQAEASRAEDQSGTEDRCAHSIARIFSAQDALVRQHFHSRSYIHTHIHI